jgi:hypothetical protein
MSVLFLRAKRPGRLPQSAPKDDPAWIVAEVAKHGIGCKPVPTFEQRRAKAIKTAEEVRERKGMKVMQTVMASWTADDA